VAILGWIIVGLAVGAVVEVLRPRHGPGRRVDTLATGVRGAVLGGLVGWVVGIGADVFFSPASWLVAAAGALTLIVIDRRHAQADPNRRVRGA
jgi:uncharacterized membrane protein YeaQ/YmgE (transglycosylase-associated protein family)